MNRKKVLCKISSLIEKKSNLHFKIAIISFIFSIITLSVSLILIYNQYIQIEKNFVNNDNTHVIEIAGLYDNNNIETDLSGYVKDISNILDKTELKNKYSAFFMYQFSYGLECEEFEDYLNVFAVDSIGEKYLLKNQKIEDDVIYSDNESNYNTLTLLLPNVSITTGGLHLNGETSYSITYNKSEINKIFNTYDALGIKPYFISYNTYAKFFNQCYSEKLSDESLIKYNSAKPIYRTFVYVDDLSNVEKTAKILNKNGYITNFVFQSFEELGESLSLSLIIMLITSIVLLIFTIVILLLSFNNYINLISKDIGILKQMGYSKNELLFIYKQIFNKLFFKISLVSSIISFIIAISILKSEYILPIIIYITVLNLLLMILNCIINVIFLKRKVDQNIIILLKCDKSFE